MSRSELLRWLKRAGWRVEIAGSGHLRCRHPDAAPPVTLARSPRVKDRGAPDLARLKRALRQGGSAPR